MTAVVAKSSHGGGQSSHGDGALSLSSQGDLEQSQMSKVTRGGGFALSTDDENIMPPETRCLSTTQCDDVIKMISHFGQHNRFQVIKSVDSGLLPSFDLKTSHVCVCKLTGQIFVSIRNLILIFDKDCSKLMATIHLVRIVHWNLSSSRICIDGNEIFVLNVDDHKIEVFSTDDFLPRRNLPLHQRPKGLQVHNSVLIVLAGEEQGTASICAMTKDGRTLWETRDIFLSVYINYGIFVDKLTDEIFVYTETGGGKICRKYDFMNGKLKTATFTRKQKDVAIVSDPNGKLMFCTRSNVIDHLEIQICSSGGEVLETKPINIPCVAGVPNLFYPGFGAGRHGELFVFFNNRLYLIK